MRSGFVWTIQVNTYTKIMELLNAMAQTLTPVLSFQGLAQLTVYNLVIIISVNSSIYVCVYIVNATCKPQVRSLQRCCNETNVL